MSKIIEIKFSIDLDNSEDTEFLKDFLALKEKQPACTEKENHIRGMVSSTTDFELLRHLEEKKIFPKKEIAEIKHSLDAEMTKQEYQKELISAKTDVLNDETKKDELKYTKMQLQELLAKKNTIDTKHSLKEKLNALGAARLSELSEEHYKEFYEFMNSL